jgi:beta-mannosidase
VMWLWLAASAREPVSLDGPWAYHAGGPPMALGAAPVLPVPSNWWVEGLKDAQTVWFARTVSVPDDGRWLLSFGGVDYEAQIWWDGVRLGEHRGYFDPFEVEVPAGPGEHLLAVRVDCPPEADADFSLRKRQIKGVLGHHDTRPGNAWSSEGQSAPTGGIWGGVSLRPIDQGLGERATLSFEVRASRLRQPGRIGWSVRDPSGARVAGGVLGEVEGDSTLGATVFVPDPQRWWPRGLGEQPLYTLEVALGEGDAVQTRFGLWTVEQDAAGRILVNGEPVFLRGTNYIGSIYLAGLGQTELGRDLDLMEAAHVNAVRVHAHVTSPAFYEETDERGLLVFQDFPLQWGYDDGPGFRQEASRQLRQMLDLLQPHPSIVYWTAHNEAPWSSDWMRHKYPDWDPDQNRALDRELGELLAREDPSRPHQANAHPSEHVWFGWYTGSMYDFAQPLDQPLLTEFGAQALPDVDVLRSFLPPEVLWPLDEQALQRWSYHGFQLHELTQIAGVPLGDSLEETVAASQEYQARLTQYAAEEMRRQKWQPVTGIFQFMFVEHWPAMTWAVLDHLRQPKPGYHALQRAYQPILPIATIRPGREGVTVYLLNDTARSERGVRVRLRYRLPAGGDGEERVLEAELRANEVTEVWRGLRRPLPAETLALTLEDASGAVLARNEYPSGWFADGAR